MKRRHALGWVVAAAGLLVSTLAQAQSVQLGNTTMDLGASRGEALAVANTHFRVVPAGMQGRYNLYPKTGVTIGEQPKFESAVGSITIEDGRLTRVTRNLGSFRSADAQAAIENMIAAFSEAPNEGKAPAVHTDSLLRGDSSISRVYFTYPDRIVQVAVYAPADRSRMATVDITEQYALTRQAVPAAPAR